MDLQTLADVPAMTLAEGAALPTTRIPVAKIGRYQDRRYGAFAITPEDYASWKANLGRLAGGQAPIDFDHGPEKGAGSKAAGWITSLELEGDKVMATVDWSRAGVDAVQGREYRFISPTFQKSWRDEQGVDRGRTLIGAGLTNRPFLKAGMPAITLSDELAGGPDFAAPSGSDSRRMLTKLAKALSLADDASEATILDALDTAVILSAADHGDLVERANAGDVAVTKLAEATFDAAFTKALDEGRTTPAMRDHLAKLDVDAAVAILEVSPVAVKTTVAGSGAAGRQVAAPEGVDATRFELHEQAEALVLSDGITYDQAIDRLTLEA